MNAQADHPGPAQPGPARVGRAPWRGRRTIARLAVSAVTGVFAAALVIIFGSWRYAPTVGWDATAATFCLLAWLAIWPMSDEATAERATEEDPSRAVTDVLMLSASVASLAAVGFVLVHAHAARGAAEGVLAGLALLSVAVSWATVHTVFTLRYALLYYSGPVGGIDFNQRERPGYRDFAYLALTVGMTFQVSDTNLQTSQIRATTLRHALLSFLFGAVILASAINLIAALGSGG
jgi:uncharacterized membrane protein